MSDNDDEGCGADGCTTFGGCAVCGPEAAFEAEYPREETRLFCSFCDNWIDHSVKGARVAKKHRVDPEVETTAWCIGSWRDEEGVLYLG